MSPRAPLPANEAGRLAALHRLAVLEDLPESELDDLVFLAAQLCAAPMAVVSFVDESREWIKARVGLNLQSVPRDSSLAAHALAQRELFVVPDAGADGRFADNPLITHDPGLRFYAAAPLLAANDQVVGVLAVMDRTPRQLAVAQKEALQAISRQVMRQIESRRFSGHAASNTGALNAWLEQTEWRAAAEHFKDAFDHAVIGMALVAPDGRWLTVNPSLCGIVGYTEGELLATNFQAITHPDDLEADQNNVRQVLCGEIYSYQQERRYVHRRGHTVWVLLSVSLVRDGAGEPLYFIFQIEDITDRKTSEAELRDAHEELKSRVAELEARTEELSMVGEMGELLQSCRSVSEAHKIIGRSIRQLFPQEAGALCVINSGRDHVEAALSWGSAVTTEGYFVPDDCWGLRRNRMHVVSDAEHDLVCPHVSLPEGAGYMCLPLMAQRETLGLLHLCRQDGSAFTSAKQQLARTLAEQISLALANLHLQETLRSQSVRDGLTGLFNRRYLEASLEREVNRAERHSRPLSIVMMDVDHFKRFNDTYGHETGDAVLREVGGLVLTLSRKADVACRYGGEEFTLILPDASLDDACQKAEQLREAVKKLDIRHNRESVGAITLSLGVAAFPLHGTAAESLIQAADAALYKAKREGRDRVIVATDERASLQ